MGKYTHLRHKLPAFAESAEASGLAAWYAKVDEKKMELLGTLSGENANASRIAAQYARADFVKRQLEAQISELNIELEALSQLGVEAMESDGAQKIDLAGGGYVSISDRPYSSVEDREKIFAWVKKNKMLDLLTLPYQTMSAMNNERLVSGKPPLPGTRVFMKTKLIVRGVNGNSEKGDDA